MARTDHFHDDRGRYVGPIKTKTAYPPSPYGDDDRCAICRAHYLAPHRENCPHAETA